MNLEQKPIQFNKDKFTTEFETALQKFEKVIYTLSIQYIMSEGKGNDEIELEKKELELDSEEARKEMIDISVQALKLADNKQEILEIISAKLLELESSQKAEYEELSWYFESHFFQDIILELLKKS